MEHGSHMIFYPYTFINISHVQQKKNPGRSELNLFCDVSALYDISPIVFYIYSLTSIYYLITVSQC